MESRLGRFDVQAIAAGGLAAILGLYWDDAWHTDRGRDTFFSPPHLLLYSGVAVLLTVAALWAWRRSRAKGITGLRDPLVALPLVGAAVTLAAAPVDEIWHTLFGRDAVVWSPPHMVAVVGMLAFAAGLLSIVQRSRASGPITASVVGAFVLAAAVTPVMEFEADVPQFSLVWYWPVLAGTTVLGFSLVGRVSRRAWAASEAALVYVGLRVGVLLFLSVLDHSLPTVMPTLIPAALFDLMVRRRVPRAVLAAGVTVALVLSYAAAHALQPAGLTFASSDVLLGGMMGTVAAWAALAAVGVGEGGTVRRTTAGFGVVGFALVALGWPTPAAAHDPGQGDELLPASLMASRVGDEVALQVRLPDGRCQDVQPTRIVARRAGQTRVGVLNAAGPCVFEGLVRVDDPGRWFLYAEVLVGDGRAETWIPVDGSHQVKDTVLYTAPRGGTSTFQILAGILLYLLVIVMLAAVVWTYRRPMPVPVTAE